MMMLAELRCVDDVIVVGSSLEALEKIRPRIFAKGPDYVGKIRKEDRDFCDANNIDIRFTDGVRFSSTELLNNES